MKIEGFSDTIAWYDGNAEKYAEASISAYSVHDREQFEHFIELLPKRARVLDAGCGSGRDTHLFSEHGFEAVGIDISQGLISEANRRFPNCQFVEGNLLKLPFAKEIFDGVWAHASLLHFESRDDVATALTEFWRVLKANGVLHVLVKAQTTEEKTAVVTDALSGHNRFFQYFTSLELQSLLENAGFNISTLLTYNETDRNPGGRPEVKWIVAIAKKNS